MSTDIKIQIERADQLLEEMQQEEAVSVLSSVVNSQDATNSEKSEAWLRLAIAKERFMYLDTPSLAACLENAIRCDPQNYEARIRWCELAWKSGVKDVVGVRPSPDKIREEYERLRAIHLTEPYLMLWLESLARKIATVKPVDG